MGVWIQFVLLHGRYRRQTHNIPHIRSKNVYAKCVYASMCVSVSVCVKKEREREIEGGGEVKYFIRQVNQPDCEWKNNP